MESLLKIERCRSGQSTRCSDSKIPTGFAILLNESGQIFHAPSPGQFPARLPWLADLKDNTAGLKNIADADIVFSRLI